MKFLLLLWLSYTIVNTSFAQITQSSEGFIFTSPRSLRVGLENELHLRRFGKLEPGVLTVQLFYSDYTSSNETLAEKQEYEIPAGEQDSFLKLFVKNFDNYVYNGRIQINGTFGEYNISGSDTVSFSTSPRKDMIFIQTDKPIYKPGQEVKFRVLKLEKNLKPSGKEEDIANIFVEDPKGTRLFQFKDVYLGSGMVQNSFPLSEEPVQGNWRISVTINDMTESATFEVKEYVLPKFDVTIKFPPYVLANAEEIPIEICAKYTYGKPVVGVLNLNSSLEKYSYSRDKYPTLQEYIKLNGCFNYTLNVSLIQTGNTYRYRRIMIVANVIEEGTGVDRNETQYLQRQYSPLNLVFANDQRQFYKPGLPYSGKLQVYHPDDTPAADESVEICATASRERLLMSWWATKKIKYCKNYTSDAKGIIQYSIPSQNTDVVSIILEAKSIKYSKEPNDRKNIMNIPQTSMTLNPFYSPSGSFIQLQPVDQPISCGTKQSFKLLFTSKENSDFEFHYQVTKQGEKILAGTLQTAFSTENDVSAKYIDKEKLINALETQIEPSIDSNVLDSEDKCPAAKESKYLPPVGEVDIDLEIDPTLSPTFYILVYYIRKDRETVADSQKIDVQKCFKNKVNFEFGDESQQPGLKTSLKITASPNSLCGIKVVDKSVSLLNNDDQLTKENVFRRIESMDNNQYYTINPCSQYTRQPGLYSSSKMTTLPPPIPIGSSSYDDSLSAFQSSGFVVISDFIIWTRPCSHGVGSGGFMGVGAFGSANVGFEAQAISLDSASPVGLSAARRPAAAPFAAEAKVGISATKSVSDVRTFFPETWLFDMEMTETDGTYLSKEKLPDTITQWIGSAVCINAEDGLGISNSASITAFQAFFLDYTLPVSVIRGEEFVLVISIHSYTEAALPITIILDRQEGFELTSDSIDGDICVHPDIAESLRVKLKATTVGKVNITVRAETSSFRDICGNFTMSNSIAKDAITKSLDVEAEGFPAEKIFNSLFCPSDQANGVYETSVPLSLPEDVVPDSSRAYVDFTGNVMGKAMDNLDKLVTLPTGCGEQNMVKFTPNYLVLDFLKDLGLLTEEVERKAKRNLNKGYQRELTYRHSDGSFSAFGEVDKQGSMFLTAFVLRSFYEAKRYISIDDDILKQMQVWISRKQQDDGCFPDVGKIIDMGLQGGIENEKSSGSVTAYVLASLLISKYGNDSIINSAFDCLANNPPMSPYGELLYAYAEVLGGKAEKAKSRLDQIKANVNKTAGMEYFVIANSSESVKVEAVAYAVLTTLKTGGSTSDILPYVRYLTANLNPRGGFKSTQDTCVGLDALSQFAKLVYKEPLNIKISSAGGLGEAIELTDYNKLLVQRFKAAKVPGEINIHAEGTGCGLIQTYLRYNTNSAPEKMNFFLDVNGECSSPNCKYATINVIVSYLPPGLKAGMTVLEVKLLTGTVPVKESLNKLVSNKSNQILRFDVENNKVVLYFSEMSNMGHVFSFQIESVVEVENSQAGTAKVYDYYANENSASTSYTVKGLNPSSDFIASEV